MAQTPFYHPSRDKAAGEQKHCSAAGELGSLLTLWSKSGTAACCTHKETGPPCEQSPMQGVKKTRDRGREQLLLAAKGDLEPRPAHTLTFNPTTPLWTYSLANPPSPPAPAALAVATGSSRTLHSLPFEQGPYDVRVV